MSGIQDERSRRIDLENKIAIITGAAGDIGRVTARTFAREGATVALVDLDKSGLDALAGTLQQTATTVRCFATDVSQEAQVQQVIQAVREEWGRVDILVNNAGICKMIAIPDITVEAWDRMMAVNLRSVFLFCREIFPIMKAQQYGKIVNLGSAAAKLGGLAAGAHYSASKAGVVCLTKSMALQLAPYKVNVNAICPSPVKSNMTEEWGKKAIAAFKAKIPFNEFAEPQDIAEAICFLASDKSKYITGEVLDINGGLLMD